MKKEQIEERKKFQASQVWSYGYGVIKAFVPLRFIDDFEHWMKEQKIEFKESAKYYLNKNKKKASRKNLAFIEGSDYIMKSIHRGDVARYLRNAYKNAS